MYTKREDLRRKKRTLYDLQQLSLKFNSSQASMRVRTLYSISCDFGDQNNIYFKSLYFPLDYKIIERWGENYLGKTWDANISF